MYSKDLTGNTGRPGLCVDTAFHVSTGGNNENKTDEDTQVKILNK